MSVNTKGARFLYLFGVGNYDYTNPGANVISVTDTMPGDFDKKNLTTYPLRETWRSVDAQGWKEIIIQADDTTTIPDTFAILHHNFSDLAVVELQGSMTFDFTAPAFTLPYIWNEDNMVLLQSVGASYRYYRWRILDPTNACGFLEIGRIVAGLSAVMTNNEDIADDISLQTTDMAYALQSEGFFQAFNERVQIDQLTLDFQKLDPVNSPNYNLIRSLVKGVGITYPFLTIGDSNDPYFICLWGQIVTLPTYAFDINKYVTFQLVINQTY